MNTPGSVIDGKYTVIDILSSEGGMGALLKVHWTTDHTKEYALKYCLAADTETRDRFRREIRLMQEFVGNSRIAQVIDSNLAHSPPYFVMPLYADGDLRTLSGHVKTDASFLETTMLRMAECVEELHRAGKCHRDIKPANFLRSPTGIVISDLGLGVDLMSQTGVTLSHQWGGTHGYIPPEFLKHGGFKNATSRSDIFMLGKSYYNLVTGLDPQFIDKSLLEKPLFYLIERCCRQDEADRYQSVPKLKQAIVSAFDIILGRLAPLGEAQALYDGIRNLLASNQYKAEDFKRFITLIEGIKPEELFSIVSAADSAFYLVLSQDPLRAELEKYLDLYHTAVLSEQYLSFSYAEHVADRMETVFMNCSDPALRARSLDLAITHAERCNRFAAMDTCTKMITGVPVGDPAEHAIVAVLQKTNAGFVKSIELSSCKNGIIADQIKKLSMS